MLPIIFASEAVASETIDNNLLSIITMHQPGQASIPVSSDISNDANKQHLIWEYSGIIWSGAVEVGVSIPVFYHYYQLQRSA